jgi:hypothetical protein
MGLGPDGPPSPLGLSRYFLIPTAGMAILVVAALVPRSDRPRPARVAALAMGGLLVLAFVGDFRLPPRPDLDWPLRSACIGGEAACTVPVHIVTGWSIEWPGAAGPYVQPEPSLDDVARRRDAAP